MLEGFKNKIYQNDQVGLKSLNDGLAKAADKNQASKEYGEAIMKKLLTLPESEQKVVSEEFDKELTRVMHKIYLSTINI